MALPLATASVVPQAPAFVNMISLLLSSPTQATSQLANTPATTVSPAQVADSMIRSMLGNLSSGSTAPSLSSAPAVGLPVAADPRTPLAPVSSEQIADSTILSMLSGLLSGSTASSAVPTAALPVTDARKQLRNVADMPTLTAMVAPMPTSVLPAAPQVAQSSPAPAGPNATVSGTPQSPMPAPSGAPLAKSEIAFTAILTPMKDTNAPDGTPDISRQLVASPGTTTNTQDVSSSSAIAPVPTASNSAQASAAQSLQPQAAVQATGKDSPGAQGGGNMQQGGDTPSQQQDDSAGTAAQVVASADSKVKPANAKQDDNELVGAIQDRASVADASLTSFPEQAHVAAATQSDAPAAAPTPFHSTAEALRTSEPELPAAPPLRAGAAQEISIRIAQPDASTIDLRVVERSGQLHVDVRSSDAAMQSSLRQDLGTLTNSLERAGYHSETFTPSSTLNRMASSAQMSNQDDRQDQSQNRGGTGDFSGGRRQQQQQKRPSTWLEEMEDQQ